MQTALALNFTFQWTRSQIIDALDRYTSNTSEMQRENQAIASGDRIASGDLDPRHLEAIIDWKSPRPKRLIAQNTPEDIGDALRVACTTPQERTAIAVLCGLRGIRVPMASAILTAINRDRYTIIDWRALKALTVKRSEVTIDNYLEYLAYCRDQAATLQVGLRDLDRALWILGSE